MARGVDGLAVETEQRLQFRLAHPLVPQPVVAVVVHFDVGAGHDRGVR
jgi:1,4-dihydroxy-2-naphthoyl-CoA synthase